MSAITKPIILNETGERIAEAIEALEAIGRPTQEQTNIAVDEWLNDHPEATTTVEDGSLTEAKFTSATQKKVVNEYITPEMYGAVGDGETDDKTAIESAFAVAYSASKTLYFPNKTYYSSDAIVIDNVPNLHMDGTIKFANTGNGLTLGKTSVVHNLKQLKISVSCENQEATDTYIGLKLINVCNSSIHIANVDGFAYGVVLVGNSNPFSYNTFFIGYIKSAVKSLVLQKTGTGGFNTENLFIGGHFIERDTTSSVAITIIGNNHVFVKPCVESAHWCFNISSSNNKIISCRSEHATYLVKFESNSDFNEIDVGYGTTAIDGLMRLNRIFYDWIGTNVMEAVNSREVFMFPNNVFECGWLSPKLATGEGTYSGTVESPLFWLNSDGLIRSSIPKSGITKNGNEVTISGGCIGVMVDCSVAKDFLLLQNGTGCGKWTVKLYGEDGNQLDMSNINIGPFTDYRTAWGGIIYSSNYAMDAVQFPTAAKKAFIGITGVSTMSLLTFAIRSRNMSVVYPDL